MAVQLQKRIEEQLQEKLPEDAVAAVFEASDPRMFFEIMRDQVNVPAEDDVAPAPRYPPRHNNPSLRQPRTVNSSFVGKPAEPYTHTCPACGFYGYVCVGGFVDERATTGDVVCPHCATCIPDPIDDEAGMNWGKTTFEDYIMKSSFQRCQEGRVRYSQDAYFQEHLQKLLGNEFFSPVLLADPRFPKLMEDPKAKRAALDGGPVRLRDYMRKLKLGRLFYQHTHSICAKFQGRTTGAQKLSDKEMEDLTHLFAKANKAFEKTKGNAKKNALNYGFVLRKLTALIGRRDLTFIVPPLKTRSRMIEHQKLWKRVCEVNGWPPIPDV